MGSREQKCTLVFKSGHIDRGPKEEEVGMEYFPSSFSRSALGIGKGPLAPFLHRCETLERVASRPGSNLPIPQLSLKAPKTLNIGDFSPSSPHVNKISPIVG